MSLSLCRTRTNNECSLGSRFDWFVVRHAHSPKDPNVKVLPKVLARVYSIYDAEVLVKYHRDLAKTKGEDCATCVENYYGENYAWEIEWVEAIGQSVNTIRSVGMV